MSDKNSIKFVVFADFHYREGVFPTSVAELEGIFDKAHACGADFVLSAGDMYNDCIRSPEFVDAFKNNKYGMPAFDVYGNHELEMPGNRMEDVTPNLTNMDVVWGTEDGKMDYNIGYYHYDINGFRLVCIDSNYSYNTELEIFEHNRPGSFGPPRENTLEAALHPDELVWLRRVILDAADKGLHCIVTAHHCFNGAWQGLSPDWKKIQAIYKEANEKRVGTVLMSINGHIHTDRQQVLDNVLYFDVNTTRIGCLNIVPQVHYKDPKHTVMFTEHDEEGNVISVRERPLYELLMSPHTWYFTDALSAIVTVSDDGHITIEGMETTWLNGVVPTKKDGLCDAANTGISSGEYWLDIQ